MKTARLPIAPSTRSKPRPFLTVRVVRGLKTLVDLGWADVAQARLPVAVEKDARYAKEWLGRMAAHVVEARDRRRTYRATKAQKAVAA